MAPVVLLGPQRRHPTLGPEMDGRGIGEPVMAITAGWQEREAEDDEMQEHLGREVVDLRLHARSEDVFTSDPELFAAHRERQDRLRALQQLYAYRLGFAIEPARELLHREGDPALLEPERESAIRALRALDTEHLRRLRAVHRDFQHRVQPLSRRVVREHRRELRRLVADAAAVAIAGGHVAVLVNRLRLFGLERMLGDVPVFAWSGGAMVCGERIVLFHDRPPQGAGNAEVLEAGLGLYPGVIPLPHAERRLRLDDRQRVALFARRFAPRRSVLLDQGAPALEWTGRGWLPAPARVLGDDGRVGLLEAA